jgi:hypothetical protein
MRVDGFRLFTGILREPTALPCTGPLGFGDHRATTHWFPTYKGGFAAGGDAQH